MRTETQHYPDAEFAGSFLSPQRLFYAGWGVTLLYLPSGLLHALLGPGVYFRDGLLFLHLIGCIIWLARSKELANVASFHWSLFVPVLFILPAFADPGSRVEAFTFVKWGALWADWICLGVAARFVTGFTTTAKILAGITVVLFLSDLVAGTYERATHSFVISGESEERTAFGVEMDREFELGAQLRVKGLQRDVFSFANLMGASAVLGLLVFLNAEVSKLRFISLFWTIAFATMLATSGGRSALFGVFGAASVALCALMVPVWTRKHYRAIVLGWLIVCLTISSVGIGRLAEFLGSSMFNSTGVGSATSAYMRDDAWGDILDTIARVPIVLIFGGPLSAFFDSKVQPFFHWADNEYLWLVYHAGIFGFASVIWYFRQVLTTGLAGSFGWMRDALVLFLLFVMGEAMARESMTFIGCMPLFMAAGYCEASRLGTPAFSKEEQGAVRKKRKAPASAVSEMAGRIRARTKAQK